MMRTRVQWRQKIIHVDMDAFFASIEQRDNPDLKGKPVVVGGNPFGRGVVSTCSYEARRFGIRSAMPAAQARKLCPSAIFVRPHFEKYAEASKTVMAILRQHTDLVEPVSLDEAYLDVTQHKFKMDDPATIAGMIKQNIHAVTKLTASAGVAPNMFLAKIASDYQKPDGLTVVSPNGIENFLRDLPVRKIPGVGPVTEEHLHKLKLFTCSDLIRAGDSFLYQHLGKQGLFLFERALGRDDRQVETEWESKQLSTEETFERDVLDKKILKGKLNEYAQYLFLNLKEDGRSGRTIVLKVKYHDFELITRSLTLKQSPKDADKIFHVASQLLDYKTLAGKKPVRLIGLGIAGLLRSHKEEPPKELELFC